VTITRRLVERLGEPLGNAVADGPQRLFPSAPWPRPTWQASACPASASPPCHASPRRCQTG
jgi:hypothetical protein